MKMSNVMESKQKLVIVSVLEKLTKITKFVHETLLFCFK